MTSAQIEASARNKYNSTSDTFYTQNEILDYIYQAQLELSQVCPIIEATSTTSTVIAQQAYAFPAYAQAVKRVEYDGRKLQKYTFRDQDAVDGLGQSTISGIPEMYAEWNGYLYLTPVPAAAATLTFFTIQEPAPMTTVSPLEIPTIFHMDIVDFVTQQMADKDENSRAAKRYEDKWGKATLRAIAWCRKRKRHDAMANVQSEEQHAVTQFGIV